MYRAYHAYGLGKLALSLARKKRREREREKKTKTFLRKIIPKKERKKVYKITLPYLVKKK